MKTKRYQLNWRRVEILFSQSDDKHATAILQCVIISIWLKNNNKLHEFDYLILAPIAHISTSSCISIVLYVWSPHTSHHQHARQKCTNNNNNNNTEFMEVMLHYTHTTFNFIIYCFFFSRSFLSIRINVASKINKCNGYTPFTNSSYDPCRCGGQRKTKTMCTEFARQSSIFLQL